MSVIRSVAIAAAALLCARTAFCPAGAADMPSAGSTDVLRAFKDLVEKESEGLDYLEPDDISRIREQAEKIFPLQPAVSSKEAVRRDREGEKAYLAGELQKAFPLTDAEVRRSAEKESQTVYPLYEKGDMAEVSYRFGKYHAKGIYYGRTGDYLKIGKTSVPVPDLPDEELRKFEPERNRKARDAFILQKCGDFAEKKRAAVRELKTRWADGREERRFQLGFLRFSQKWLSGEQILDELLRRKNHELLKSLRDKASRTAKSGDLSGAKNIFQDFLSRHPALSSELKPDLDALDRTDGENRVRTALEQAAAISDPDQAQVFLKKLFADDPGPAESAKIRSALAELEIRSGERKKCRETIESARALEPEDACSLLEHFMAEYSDYCGMEEVKAFYAARKKEGDRRRCDRILKLAEQTRSDEEAAGILERFLEDHPDCEGIESVREACRKRRAKQRTGDSGDEI